MAPQIKIREKGARKLPSVSGAYDLWISGSEIPGMPRPSWRLIPLGICADVGEAIEAALAVLPRDENFLSQWEYLHDGVLVWQAHGRYARLTARILH
jgi:hypothetical protein